MLTGEKYEHILSNLKKETVESLSEQGLSYSDDAELLWSLGFDFEFHEELKAGWKPTKNKALLTVPSKNFSGKLHSVYWNGNEVIDPSPLDKYSTDAALRAAIDVFEITPTEAASE